MSAPDKSEMERQLDSEWQALRALVDSLTDDELQEPGVVEEWSVKDLLGHMAFWASKAAGDLKLLVAGRPDEIPTPGSEQATAEWNARESAARRDRTLSHVRDELERSFADAAAALKETQDSSLDTEVKGWTMRVRFIEDTYNHYKEHAAQIRAWQREMETTEA